MVGWVKILSIQYIKVSATLAVRLRQYRALQTGTWRGMVSRFQEIYIGQNGIDANNNLP